MKIELYPEISTPNEFKKAVKNLIEFYVPDINLDSIVDRIILAEYDYYGDAIKSINNESTFTETNGYIGIAKTIHLHEINKSSIVIRNNLIANIFDDYSKDDNLSNWSESGLQSLNTLIHEIGHAFDYQLRSTDSINLSYRNPFQLEKLIDIYVPEILSEIAANNFSRKYVGASFEELLRKQLQGELRAFHKEINKLKTELNYHTTDKVKFEFSEIILYMLFRLQEYFCYSDNISLFLSECEEDSFGWAQDYFLYVKELQDSYPKWLKSFNGKVRDLFREIISEYQVSLELKEKIELLNYHGT